MRLLPADSVAAVHDHAAAVPYGDESIATPGDVVPRYPYAEIDGTARGLPVVPVVAVHDQPAFPADRDDPVVEVLLV